MVNTRGIRIGAVIVTIVLAGVVVWISSVQPGNPPSNTGAPQSRSANSDCESEPDIALAIQGLSASWSKADQPTQILLQAARTSPQCRTAVVEALVLAMNKPNLDFVSDRASYYLWSNGSAILGELKAIEALDLLISHLDLNDGLFSASMVHQPAIPGVRRMGDIAVPKLKSALQQNENRNIRLASALCLVDIGGAEAMDALKEALKTESDQCVRRFIELSFERPTAEVLQERVMAFRCGN